MLRNNSRRPSMSKASDLARLITSGSTAIHGEAGVTSSGSTGLTTNLQQGLAKAWAAFDGSGTVEIDDSNNIASMTDNGTGDYTLTITNDMANANYAPVSSCNFNGTSPDFVGAVSKAVGSTEFHAAHDDGGLTDMNDLYASWHGDLA